MIIRVFLLVGLLSVIPGCGSPASATNANAKQGNKKAEEPTVKIDEELRGLGVAYHAYHDGKRMGPSSAEDMLNFISSPEGKEKFTKSDAYKLLKSGEIVINPRLQFRSVKDLGKTYLFYEKKVPKEGGYVVLGTAEVVRIKPEAFANLEKGDEGRAPEPK